MRLYQEIENCFRVIEDSFSVEKLLEFKNTPVGELYLYHFGLGIWIRNNLLTEKSALYKSFIENNIAQKDDMSSLIITLFHKHLSNHTRSTK